MLSIAFVVGGSIGDAFGVSTLAAGLLAVAASATISVSGSVLNTVIPISGDEVNRLVKEIKDEIIAKFNGTAKPEDVAALKAQITDLQGKLADKGELAKLQSQLDALEVKSKYDAKGSGTWKQWYNEKLDSIKNDPIIKAISEGRAQSGKTTLSMTISELKTVGTMLTSTHTDGNVVPVDYQTELIKAPYNLMRIRSLMVVTPTMSDTVRYIAKENKEGAPTTVTPGNAKPDMDWEYNAKDAVVRDIAGYLRIHKNMLTDIQWLAGELSTDLPEEIRDVEDTQLLTGDGNAPNLNGLITQATAFNGAGISLTAPNNYDVLVAAITQIKLAKYKPSAIPINPTDYAALRLTKDSSNAYVFPRNEPMAIDGIPIIENTAISAGTFLVGDFVRGAKIHEREGITVEFFPQDADNVTKNLITVRGEERIALAVKHPLAFVTGTFAAAKVTLTPTTTTPTTTTTTTSA